MLAAVSEDRDRRPSIAKSVPALSRTLGATREMADFLGVFRRKRVAAIKPPAE